MDPAAALALVNELQAASVVLVEGESDRSALGTLAARRGLDLPAASVVVVPMGGASGIAHFMNLLGPPGAGLRLSGLFDEAEIGYVRRAAERAGFFPRYEGSRQELFHDTGARDALAARGFFACVTDLEDELIRALGVEAVLEVVRAEGEAARFGTFAAQPDHRGRSPRAQLHRFLGTRRGRKIQYADRLVRALAPGQEPACLTGVLDAAVRAR